MSSYTRTTRTVKYGPGGQTTIIESTSGMDGYKGFKDVNGPGRDRSGSVYPEDGSSSRYSSGWKPKSDLRPSGPPMKLKGVTYAEIKAQCLAEGQLFEDPDFPAVDSSIFFSRSPPRPFVWLRPPVSSYYY